MTLILTEKPSVANDFATALSADKKPGYFINESTGTVVTYCLGHLLELYEPQDYSENYNTWSVDDLPIVPKEYKYKPNSTTQAQLNNIHKLLSAIKKDDKIIIATDAGREGELIARLVLRSTQVKSNSIYRFWSSAALTKDVIEEGIKNVKPDSEYDRLFQSGLYRQWSDWLVGINFSRLFTIKLKTVFSFGRVQTPILREIVSRDKEIENFKTKPFYTFDFVLTKEDGFKVKASLYDKDTKSINFESKEILIPLAAKILKQNTNIPVTEISTTRYEDKPPQLFNLTALQKEANKIFGYSADQTLSIAQNLYEKHKVLSYPRTPSRVLSESNFQYVQTLYQAFSQVKPELFKTAVALQQDNKHIFDDSKMEDHHALLPLKPIESITNITDEERNVFTIVLVSFARVCAGNYLCDNTTIFFETGGFCLRSRGTRILDPGWKSIIVQPEKKIKEDEKDTDVNDNLPQLIKGEELCIVAGSVNDHQTKPPRAYTDASILAYMEKNNLGTEATRAEILSTLVRRTYCARAGKKLLSTDKGKFFIKQLLTINLPSITGFLDEKNTSLWESMLKKSPEEFYNSLVTLMTDAVKEIKTQKLNVYIKKLEPDGTCPLCGADIHVGEKYVSCSKSSDKTCKLFFAIDFCSHHFTKQEIDSLLKKKTTKPIQFKSKSGKDFSARVKIEPTEKGVLSFIFEQK